MHLTDSFLAQCEPSIPGTLIALNVADFKRYNMHLGYLAGDQVIAAFEHALQRSVRDDGCCSRVGGGAWLVVVPTTAVEQIAQMIRAFHNTTAITVGWELIAHCMGDQRIATQTVRTTLTRAVRGLAIPIQHVDDLRPAARFLEACPRAFLPSQLLTAHEVTIHHMPWSCIAEYPPQDPACACCQSTTFAWDAGDDSIYGGTGTCRGCGATIQIRDYTELVSDLS